jgi:pimeloyl-ACP methyl ester carboxylesterase
MGFYTPEDTTYTSLNDFIAPFLTQLDNFQPVGRNFADTFETDNQTYFTDSNTLVNQKVFWGYGSQAFLTSVSKQISDTDPLVRGLRHVSSETYSYRQTVDALTSQYATQIAQQVDAYSVYSNRGIGSLRDALVGSALPNVDLNTLLQSGSVAVTGPLAAAKSTLMTVVAQTVHSTFAGYRPLTPQEQQVQQMQTTDIQGQVSSAYALVSPILEQWADALCQETRKYGAIIQNADNYMTAGDMFLTIFHPGEPGPSLQNTNKPIEIVPFTMPDGSTRLLVYIAGTDGFHTFYADNIPRAIEFGKNPDANAPYLKDVENAIQSYLTEHPEMKNPQVTLMGYSLGGMVGQYLANNAANYGTNFDSVIAVGSPVMGPPADFSPTSGVDYKLYMGTGDLIPLLSTYEAQSSTIPGDELKRMSTAYQMSWNDKLHQYIDPTNQYGNSIIPVSDLPFTKDSIASELAHVLPNHVLYQQSNFLENQSISQFNNATQSGVPEYFPVTNFH